MKIFTGIKELVTLSGAARKDGRHVNEEDLTVVANGAIVENKGRLAWVGSEKDIPPQYRKKAQRVSLRADCVMPAFVECHTHLVFSGDRRNEFELRNKGVSYQEIARQGGGIRSTVRATRAASEAELVALARQRAGVFLRQGVTTIESKSGYGLEEKGELKILEVIQKLSKERGGARWVGTYLGAHAIPEGRTADDYLDEMMEKTLPLVSRRKLSQRVDMFVEDGYFTPEAAKKYFSRASGLGFRLTAHADQLTRTGAGVLLASLGAESVDHLVHISSRDIEELAKSKTTCVLLPASDFYLKINYPPARKLVDEGARVALATDYNPGSSPVQDLSLVGVLARLEMKMSLPEVIAGYTVGAAHALGLGADLGSLDVGKFCDFIQLSGSWRDLFYGVGHHPVAQVYKEGRRIDLKKT